MGNILLKQIVADVAWSGATGYIGHSSNTSVHVSVTEEANWTQAYDWVNGSSNRYEEILASGNEYSSTYASSQASKVHSYHAIISGQYIKDYIASSTAIKQFYPSLLGQVLSSQVWDVYTSTNEPTGFLNRTDSTLYWSDVDRQFAISAASTTFDYYFEGTKYTIASANIQIPDTTGLHYLYLSSNRDFIDSVSPDLTEEAGIFRNKPLVSIIYWNKSSQTAPYVGEERHGIQMDGDTHQYLHYIEGTRWLDGLALNTISSNGDGDEDSHAQFGVDVGTVIDEDISIDNSSVNSIVGLPIYYRSGTSGIWFKTTNTGFSVLTAGTGRLAWNQNDSGTWSLQEVDNLDFVLAHVFGTTEKDDSVISIIGQAEYDGTADAREGATTEVNSLLLGDLPGPEMRPIATVIFQTANGYDNAVKGRIRTTDEDDDYVDWRTTAFWRGIAASDHGSLGGLDDDDHTHYYNATRLNSYISKVSSSAIWASSNYYKHSSNRDVHFPSSSIRGWLDKEYLGSSQAIERFSDSSNVNWTKITAISSGFDGRLDTLEALDEFDHELYATSANAISRFVASGVVLTSISSQNISGGTLSLHSDTLIDTPRSGQILVYGSDETNTTWQNQLPSMTFNIANTYISAQQNINLTRFDAGSKNVYIWQAVACNSGGATTGDLSIELLSGSTSVYSTSSAVIQQGYPLAKSDGGDTEIRFMYSGTSSVIGEHYGTAFMQISVY